MPLQNHKHEKFVQLLATGLSASAAYSSVYNVRGKVADSAGGRLFRNVAVQQRVAELQAKAAKGAVLTLQRKRDLLRQWAEDDGAALKDRLKAVELDAKLAGEMREKVELEHSGGVEIIIGTA